METDIGGKGKGTLLVEKGKVYFWWKQASPY
jgi:hypothetical protein